MSFYIQLYTIREETAKDFFGALERLAKIGYDGVEFAGYAGIPAADMAAKLKELGMTAPSSHVSMQRLEDDLEGEIAYLKTVGGKYMTVPSSKMESDAQVLELAKQMDHFAKACNDAGLQFAYHNHGFEFNKESDRYFMDILLKNTKYVDLELDLYWAQHADVDLVSYVQKWKDRIKLLHIKDMENMETKRCVDAGSGMIDFGKIVAMADKCEFCIYEQEEFAVSAWDSTENSYKNMAPILAGR